MPVGAAETATTPSCSPAPGGSTCSLTFMSSGSWTVPAGVTSVSIILAGGSGGAGGFNAGSNTLPSPSPVNTVGGLGSVITATASSIPEGTTFVVDTGAEGTPGGITSSGAGGGTGGGESSVSVSSTPFLVAGGGGGGGAYVVPLSIPAPSVPPTSTPTTTSPATTTTTTTTSPAVTTTTTTTTTTTSPAVTITFTNTTTTPTIQTEMKHGVATEALFTTGGQGGNGSPALVNGSTAAPPTNGGAGGLGGFLGGGPGQGGNGCGPGTAGTSGAGGLGGDSTACAGGFGAQGGDGGAGYVGGGGGGAGPGYGGGGGGGSDLIATAAPGGITVEGAETGTNSGEGYARFTYFVAASGVVTPTVPTESSTTTTTTTTVGLAAGSSRGGGAPSQSATLANTGVDSIFGLASGGGLVLIGGLVFLGERLSRRPLGAHFDPRQLGRGPR